MTTSLRNRTLDTTLEHPGPVESWNADIVDAGRVNARLTSQWLRLTGPRPQRLSGIARPGDVVVGAESVPGVFARTNTTNLVVCARSAAQADRAGRAVASFQTHYPTRAITVASDPALDRRQPDGIPDDGVLAIDTRLVRPDSGSRTVGHFESVTITGGPRQLGNPTSTAIPLCVPDLPIVLWWTGDLQYDLGMFRDLATSSDRVVLDSAAFGDLPRGMTNLASIVGQDPSVPQVVVDLAWSRLRDWRNLIAHFYDAPPDPDALANIESVTIEFSGEPVGGLPAGQAGAFLLAGWLASRLGWRMSDPVERTPGGPLLRFRTPRSATVEVRLQPTGARVTTSGIARVTIESAGSTPGTCRVEQVTGRELVTTSVTPEHPVMTRYVMASATGDSALLERVLQDAARDPVYEGALAVAAEAFSGR